MVLDDIQKRHGNADAWIVDGHCDHRCRRPDQGVLTYTIRGSDNSPDDITVTGELTNATTVTFAREASRAP